MRFFVLPFVLLVAILSTLVQADACANGLTICGSGSISCSNSYCTVRQNGKTRYFCPPASNNCPQPCVNIDSGSTTIPRCTGGGSQTTTSPVQNPTSTPAPSQPPRQRCTFLRRLYRLC